MATAKETTPPTAEEQAAIALAAQKYGATLVKEWVDNGYDASMVDFLEQAIPDIAATQHSFVASIVQLGNKLEVITRMAPHGQLGYLLRRAGVSEDVALMARRVYGAVQEYPQLEALSVK